MEREKPQIEDKNSYQMGVDFYERRINENAQKLQSAETDYERLTIIESIEEDRLRISQNKRRDALFNQGISLDDVLGKNESR